MSLTQMLKALTELGLTNTDAEVYLFLARAGSQKARIIAHHLGVQRQQVYRSLKTLSSKEMVNTSSNYPKWFSAVSLEKVLDTLTEGKREEAQRVEQKRKEILESWQATLTEDVKS